MKTRAFLAAIAGIATAFITIFVIEMIGMRLFPVEQRIRPENYEQLKLMMVSIPVGALITVSIGHGLSVLAGAFVINRIEASAMVGMLILFVLILVSTIMNLVALPHPLWFMITDITLVILGGLLSWKLFNWKGSFLS
jgi:hypothetical protein